MEFVLFEYLIWVIIGVLMCRYVSIKVDINYKKFKKN